MSWQRRFMRGDAGQDAEPEAFWVLQRKAAQRHESQKRHHQRKPHAPQQHQAGIIPTPQPLNNKDQHHSWHEGTKSIVGIQSQA